MIPAHPGAQPISIESVIDESQKESTPVRKRLIVVAVATVSAMALTACGSSGSSGKSTSGDGGNGAIIFQGPGGTFGDALKANIAEFTKETGIKVTYSEGTTSVNFAKVLAEKSNPQISVVNINPNDAARGAAQGLFLPMNSKLVHNLADAYPSLAKVAAPDAAPLTVTAEGLAYNTKALSKAGIAPPESLSDLDNPKLKGHVALSPPNGNFGINMLIIETLANGGSLDDVDPGFDALKKLKDGGIWALTPQATADNDAMMSQGTAWVQYNSTAHVGSLAAQGVPVKFVYPKPTGAVMELSTAAVVKGAPNSASAYKLVNFLLGAAPQTAAAKAYVGPVNAKVKLAPDVAKYVPYGQSQLSKLYEPDVTKTATNSSKWVSEWNHKLG
jgi:putative spermidine/putrescine transport system substrate-binding protein